MFTAASAISSIVLAAESPAYTVHQLLNADSPRGKQHCQLVTMYGYDGSNYTDSLFWKGFGYKYVPACTGPNTPTGCWTYGAECPTYFNYTNRCFDNYNGDQRAGDTHNVRYREWGVCESDPSASPPFICTPGADCINQTMTVNFRGGNF